MFSTVTPDRHVPEVAASRVSALSSPITPFASSTPVERCVEHGKCLQIALFFRPQRGDRRPLRRPAEGAMLATSPRNKTARGRVEHTAETTADSLWDAIAARLRDTLSETTYDTWFGHVEPR